MGHFRELARSEEQLVCSWLVLYLFQLRRDSLILRYEAAGGVQKRVQKSCCVVSVLQKRFGRVCVARSLRGGAI